MRTIRLFLLCLLIIPHFVAVSEVGIASLPNEMEFYKQIELLNRQNEVYQHFIQKHTEDHQSELLNEANAALVETKEDSELRIELVRIQKELDSVTNRFNQQDIRIGDLAFYLSVFGIGFGVLITAVVIFFSFRYANQAKAEARDAIEEWITNHASLKLDELTQVEIEKIRKEADPVLTKLEQDHLEFRNALENLNLEANKVDPETKKELGERVEKIRKQPEREHTAEDWYQLGIDSYFDGYYEEAISYWSRCIREPKASNGLISRALFNKALTLGKLNQPNNEIRVYDEVMRRFGDGEEDGVQEQVVRSLFNKGISLGKLGRKDEEIAAYDEVVNRYGENKNITICKYVGDALINKAITLFDLGQVEEATAVNDDVISRFGDSSDELLRANATIALTHKGVILAKTGRPEDALDIYAEVENRFGDSEGDVVRVQVIRSRVARGDALRLLNRKEEALAVYDQLIAQYENSDEDRFKEPVASALHSKAILFGKEMRFEDAIAANDKIINLLDSPGEIHRLVNSASCNNVELKLAIHKPEEALQDIEKLEGRFEPNDVAYAVLPFLAWLADEDRDLKPVLKSAESLAPYVDYSWSFDELQSYLDTLPEGKKKSAACFISFFEEHHDLGKLNECLA
ncbi:MAG: tetratricopeptide repeat protein [Sedimenticola sp.]